MVVLIAADDVFYTVSSHNSIEAEPINLEDTQKIPAIAHTLENARQKTEQMQAIQEKSRVRTVRQNSIVLPAVTIHHHTHNLDYGLYSVDLFGQRVSSLQHRQNSISQKDFFFVFASALVSCSTVLLLFYEKSLLTTLLCEALIIWLLLSLTLALSICNERKEEM